MSETVYSFPGLSIHEAIIVQKAVLRRKETLNLQQSNKAIKAILSELDQIHDDLDKQIANEVRMQEYRKEGERLQAQD